MRIEIIAIGDEILSGKKVNTGSATLASLLEERGFVVSYQFVLPDDMDVIQKGIDIALKRSDILLVTGGLGPTDDDITLEAISKLLNTPLQMEKKIAQDLEDRFPKENLEKQAQIPKGAEFFINKLGSAPGILLTHLGKKIILLPGVPLEMEKMVKEDLLPYLEENFPISSLCIEKNLSFFQLKESDVQSALHELSQHYPEVKIGIYPYFGVVMIRLKGEDENILDLFEKKLIDAFSPFLYSFSGESPAQALNRVMIDKRKKLALGESCSGGAIAAHITELPNASLFFLGSIVSYSNEVKISALQVKKETLEKYGAVSKETVKEMLDGVFALTGSDYAICVSGVAGPGGGSLDKPVGTVVVGIGEKEGEYDIGIIHGPNQRQAVIEYTTNVTIGMMVKRIEMNQLFFS